MTKLLTLIVSLCFFLAVDRNFLFSFSINRCTRLLGAYRQMGGEGGGRGEGGRGEGGRG